MARHRAACARARRMIPAQNIVAWGTEDGGGVPIRLKIEVNTGEIEAFDGPTALPLEVANPWFSGGADIPTFAREEMMVTKLRALLQRDKGLYLDLSGHATSRAGSRSACSPS